MRRMFKVQRLVLQPDGNFAFVDFFIEAVHPWEAAGIADEAKANQDSSMESRYAKRGRPLRRFNPAIPVTITA